ncbi:MAG: hypothetical protein LBI03_04510 [Clostridiales bacterium]|jgi:hypothetical protein|nr:hypothetical protein [Clostridiales bacterium]
MMESILRGLFNGKIIPWERHEKSSPELLKVVRKLESEEKYFTEKMSLDDCQRFQAFTDLQAELLSAEEDNIFAYGYSLGVLMMVDVMKEAETMGEN